MIFFLTGQQKKNIKQPSRLVSHSVGSSSLAGVRSFVILISSFSLRRPLEESLWEDWIQTDVKNTCKNAAYLKYF